MRQFPLNFLPQRVVGFSLAILASIAFGAAATACQFPVDLLQRSTPTPTATATQTPIPLPTATPSPTPAPTLVPQARIDSAEQDLFFGDYESALRSFITALETAQDPEIEAAALLGVGRVQWLAGESTNALQTFRSLVDRYPDSPQAGDARIFLAHILEELDRYGDAAAEYQAYLERFPGILDAYVLVWQADALRAAGRPLEAVDAYTTALNTPRLPGDEEWIRIRIAGALADSGDLTTALAVYSELSATASNEGLKPTLLLLRGDLLVQLGQPDEAYGLYAEAIANYPRAYDSYIALLRLVDAGVPVNDFDRGLVDYFAGEYSLSVFAFDRFLTDAPEDHDGSAHYYKGLAYRAIDAYDEAIAAWTELIQTHNSADPFWDDAWEEIGDTQWAYLGDDESAIATFESFTARVPDHPRAAEFLFFAAQLAERDGQLERAVAFWERVTSEYPTHWQVTRSHFLAGITHYRLGNYGAALGHFQAIQSVTTEPLESSQAGFWIGKTQLALGDPPAATFTFEQTAALDPTGYYSERARDLLDGQAPFALPVAYDLAIDWQAERALAEGWMRVNFSLPETTDFSSPGPLAGDIRFVRGTALWNLGFYELARGEFESLRAAMSADPVNNYRLANYLLDLGLYRTAIFCARQVLTIAGMNDAATRFAPPWFNHVRFGTYYADLVLPAAAENDLHPLFVWSVIRQESLFEGFVRSTAGARGLMQIIPATGEGIYQNLGWPENYSAEDLYRPYINITFGVDYLASQRNYFTAGGPVEPVYLYAALAAYNGGPGNSAAWLSLAQNDPDLFLEIVRFDETRRYIRGIYELYGLYYALYDRFP